jgi:hypothetical protein
MQLITRIIKHIGSRLFRVLRKFSDKTPKRCRKLSLDIRFECSPKKCNTRCNLTHKKIIEGCTETPPEKLYLCIVDISVKKGSDGSGHD